MVEDSLNTLLDEAAHVATDYPAVANGVDDSLHEYLRYAVLRLLEGNTERLSPTVDVTVGYGRDKAMAESWRATVSWWDELPGQEDWTRFRVFYPDNVGQVPQAVVDLMSALGAWRVWSGDALNVGAYDYRGRREVHYCALLNSGVGRDDRNFSRIARG
uniref:hypothetical protein n=1 Tax=Halarchaeum acidiphilum TaxID=489138 RepID=UPI001F267F62|nr:hypothetical protein [Halarchaeum acidiphilum]